MLLGVGDLKNLQYVLESVDSYKDPILGSENWTQVFRQSNFKVRFLSVPFIY